MKSVKLIIQVFLFRIIENILEENEDNILFTKIQRESDNHLILETIGMNAYVELSSYHILTINSGDSINIVTTTTILW